MVDPRADLRGEQLRLRRDEAEVAALVLEPGGPPDEAAGRLDLGRHVGDHERDALERADRPAELLARLRVRDRRVEGGLGEPTASAPIEMRPPSRIRRNVLKPLPCSPSRFAAGTRAPSKRSSPVAEACSPSLSSSRPTLKPGVSAGTMNALISAAPSSRVPGPGGDDVRARLAGVGDEALAAVEDPGPAVGPVLEPRGRPGPARIAAGARLGQAVRADDLAPGHRHEEALLLLVRAGQVERAAAEARVGGDDQPERAPHPADLLDRDGVGQGVEPGAALVLGDRDAQPAELADPADDLGREAPRALVLVDDRRDLGEHEVADRVAQEDVLRARGRGPWPRAYTGTARARTPVLA